MKGGIVAGAAAAALGSAALVADRRIRAVRRRGRTAVERDYTAPTPDRAGYVRADDGVRLYYEQDGPRDAPATVVLLHGFCLHRDDLLFQRRALIDRFGAQVRVVSIDLRRHGRSSRSDADHATIDQLGADLDLVLGKVAPDGSLVLIGHSMGAMTILALADANPELFAARVKGVGLIATSTGKLAWLTLGVPAGLARVADPAVRVLLGGVRSQSRVIERGRDRLTDAAWVFVRRLGFGPDVDVALVEFLAGMIGATPVDVVADFFPTLTSHDKLAALDVLLDIPVVIVCGDNDLVTPPDHSRAMADQLPRASLVLVPDAGHQALMERPDVVNPPLLRLVADALA